MRAKLDEVVPRTSIMVQPSQCYGAPTAFWPWQLPNMEHRRFRRHTEAGSNRTPIGRTARSYDRTHHRPGRLTRQIAPRIQGLTRELRARDQGERDHREGRRSLRRVDDVKISRCLEA